MPIIAAGIIGAAGIGGALINRSGSQNTTTQQSGPPAQVLQNYQNLVNQATGVSSGLSGLGGPPVANWNNELTSGIANINQAGDAVNYFNSGLGALNTGMGTVGGALNYLPSEISGIGAAQSMIPGAQGLVGAGASTMSGALPYYGAAGSTISGALPMYGAAANTEMSALPYYSQGASTLGGALSSYGTGLGTLGSATPYFGAGAGLVGQSTANPFTSGSISQYMSPYINDVVNSTEQQFNNQNAIQANNLTSSAIMGGNAFGGDRAGVAQGVLAGQQQTAEAPVIAGLYNSGYQTAGQEAAQQQGLLQSAGSLMGSLGTGLGGIGAEYGSLGAGMTGAAQAYGSLGSGIAGVGQGLGSLASGEVGAGSALGSVGAGIAGVGSGLGSLGGISGGLAGEAGSLAGMYGSAAGVQGGLGATQAGIGSQISALGPAWASTLEGLGGSQLTGGSAIQNWEQQNLSSGYQGLLNQLGVTGTQFLAPIVEGTGSLSGGTSTTTSPGPSLISQMAGLGVSGLALNQMTGGGLSSGIQNYLGGSPSYGGGSYFSGDAYGGSSSNPLPGLTSGDYGRYGGRIGYDDGGSVDDSSGNNDPSGGLGGIVGYNALARALGTGAAANQLAASLEEGVGFADGGAPNLPTGQPLNMSALLQGSGAGIPGQYGMTFQRGPGPPGLHMGMGPPQPPRAAAPDNGLNNLLAQVQQVTRYMRPNQNQSRKGGRIAFGGAVNLPGHYDAGGDVPEDATLPSNATPDVSGDIAPVNQDNWDRWLHGQSYLESPNGAPSQSSSAKGYFQFIDGTAKRATDAGLPNPQQGSYDSQADATKQYIQHFHPSAADAINAGDFGTATKLLNKEWPSLPGGSQMQNPSQYGAWQQILGGDSNLPAASTPTQGTLPSTPTPSSAIGKPDPWQAVLAAGLGMMAGQSPHALSNIGQGGLMGLQNYQQQKVELREEASQQLAAQRLAQEAAYQQGQLKNETTRTSILQQSAQQEAGVRERIASQPIDMGTITDQFGNKIQVKGQRDPATGKLRPIDPRTGEFMQPGQNPGGGGFDSSRIDSSLVGDAYLKQFPPEMQASVKDYLAGRQMPTGNPRTGPVQMIKQIAQKYGSDIGMPADDATFAARRQMRTDLSRTTPGSLGGQLTFAGTSLSHLANVADKAADLNNVNGFGIAPLAHIANSVRDLGTDQAAKVNAVNSEVQHYGQEVTKFYAGSPGGEAERTRFLSTMDGAKSSAEIAGAIRAERDLIPERVNQTAGQITQALGPEEAQKQLARVDLPGVISRINAGLAKLDPTGPEAQALKEQSGGKPTNGVQFTGRTATNPKTNQTLRETADGKWVP